MLTASGLTAQSTAQGTGGDSIKCGFWFPLNSILHVYLTPIFQLMFLIKILCYYYRFYLPVLIRPPPRQVKLSDRHCFLFVILLFPQLHCFLTLSEPSWYCLSVHLVRGPAPSQYSSVCKCLSFDLASFRNMFRHSASGRPPSADQTIFIDNSNRK